MKRYASMLSTFSNYIYILKKLIKSDTKLAWICVIMILVGLGTPLSNILFPKLMIWTALQNPISWSLLLGVIAVFFVITSLCNGTHNYYIRRNNFYLSNFGFKLQEDIQEISMKMPFPMAENNQVLNEIKLAEACIAQTKPIIETFCRCVSACILLVGYAVMIAQLSPLVLLVFAVCVFLDALVMKNMKNKEAGERHTLADAARKKEYLFQTMFDYRFGKELRLFNLADTLTAKFNGYKNRKYYSHVRIERKKMLAQSIEELLSFGCELAIYGFLFIAYLTDGLSVDNFVLYTGIAASFHLISKGLIADLSTLFLLNVSIADYRKLVEGNPSNLPDRTKDTVEEDGCRNTEIVFEHVSFRYPGTDQEVLHDLSFVIEADKHVSIVGLNGAGKSTIIKLICRLYRPDSGSILLGGQNIWDYESQSYTKLLSAVFQESRLFACTIAENICLEEAPDKRRMWEALRAVGMEEKIRSLPQQENSNTLKHLYDDGVEFSGGETQRLCIARAVYKQSSILLLDEPTAALDALAEKSIYESFSQVSRGKTTIFISHRLNSNQFCDKVIYIEKGSVIAQGTHKQLMEHCEPYHKLYQMQAKYYLTGQVTEL